MKLSVVIPAHDEEGSIEQTVRGIARVLDSEKIPHEILVVLDHCTDATAEVVAQLAHDVSGLVTVVNRDEAGFGMAVRAGLSAFTGDCVAIMMGDASDDPLDLVFYYRLLQEGYDCAFGSRFVRGSKVVAYPVFKLIFNRLGNLFIRVLFRLPFNDVTNAFKCYRREVIAGCQPLISKHFNLTVELPLKAIVRGFTVASVPIHWYGRTDGVSSFKIKEMGSRYLFIILYAWLEKHLSRGDYRFHREAGRIEQGSNGDVLKRVKR